jgi:hypothetical protein
MKNKKNLDIPQLENNTYLQQIYFLAFLFKAKHSVQFIQLALNGFKVLIEFIQFFMCKPNCHIITNVFISFQSKLKHCLGNDLLYLSARSSLKVQRPSDIFKLKAINRIYDTHKQDTLLKLTYGRMSRVLRDRSLPPVEFTCNK